MLGVKPRCDEHAHGGNHVYASNFAISWKNKMSTMLFCMLILSTGTDNLEQECDNNNNDPFFLYRVSSLFCQPMIVFLERITTIVRHVRRHVNRIIGSLTLEDIYRVKLGGEGGGGESGVSQKTETEARSRFFLISYLSFDYLLVYKTVYKNRSTREIDIIKIRERGSSNSRLSLRNIPGIYYRYSP